MAYPTTPSGYSAVPVFDMNGKQVFELVYVDKGSNVLGLSYASEYPMVGESASPLFNEGVVIGTKYWADVINTKNIDPIQMYVFSASNYSNAAAAALSMHRTATSFDTSLQLLPKAIQNRLKLHNLTVLDDVNVNELKTGDKYAFGFILVGDYLGSKSWDNSTGFDGWYVNPSRISHLPSNEGASDFVATLNHELTHTLGMHCSKIATYLSDTAAQYIGEDEGGFDFSNTVYMFADNLNIWDQHLMDQHGNMAN